MMRNNKKNRGMTLMEMMITIAIMAIFFTCCFSLMNSGLNSWRMINNDMQDQAALRLALLTVSRDLHMCQTMTDAVEALNSYKNDTGGVTKALGVNKIEYSKISDKTYTLTVTSKNGSKECKATTTITFRLNS